MNISRQIFKTEHEAKTMAGRIEQAGNEVFTVARLAVSRSGFWFVDFAPAVAAPALRVEARIRNICNALALAGWENQGEVNENLLTGRHGYKMTKKGFETQYINFHSAGGYSMDKYGFVPRT